MQVFFAALLTFVLFLPSSGENSEARGGKKGKIGANCNINLKEVRIITRELLKKEIDYVERREQAKNL